MERDVDERIPEDTLNILRNSEDEKEIDRNVIRYYTSSAFISGQSFLRWVEEC